MSGTLAGVLLCRLACQALKGAPWVGSYSVVQCVRCLRTSLSIFQLLLQACVEREGMAMAPPLHVTPILPCFHGYVAFLHRLFPPQSPLSHPLDPSLHSQQQPSPWNCSTIPKFPFPAAVPSRLPAYLSGLCMAVARTVWFSFHLGATVQLFHSQP